MTPRYQPFYCEENVWHLAREPELRGRERRVVFISNPSRSVALWQQRASPTPDAPVVWDYHVILLARAGGWQVWDLDTRLGCPVAAGDYLAATFPAPDAVPPRMAPRFRVIDADDYARGLRTDRSHMRDARGRLARPAPPWPCIGAPGEPPNLFRYVDMEAPFEGEVVDLPALRRAFV